MHAIALPGTDRRRRADQLRIGADRPALASVLRVAAFTVASLLAWSTLSSAVRAQVSRERSSVPGHEGCIALLIIDAQPAVAEWSAFVGGGIVVSELTAEQSAWGGAMRVGGIVDFGIATFGERDYGGPMHLRLGPYLLGESDLASVLVEVGAELSLGQVAHARWGTFGLRLGVARGFETPSGPTQAAATLLWGVRAVAGRYSERGACDYPAAPAGHGYASGFRFYAGVRTTVAGGSDAMIHFGIEVEPSFLFPPYSLSRLIGSIH